MSLSVKGAVRGLSGVPVIGYGGIMGIMFARAGGLCPSLRGALLAGVILSAPSGAWAQAASGSAAEAAARAVAVPAGPLTQALNRLAAQTGLQIVFDAALAEGRSSPGVSGHFTPSEALVRLLAGTGLVHRSAGGNAVTLERLPQSGAVTLGPVTVEGQGPAPQGMMGGLPPAFAGGQVARGGQLGLLGNRDVMDTPFNLTSYTAKLLQDQQARSIADAVANDPSTRNLWSAVSYTAPLTVRGFSVSNQDVSLGGLYGVAPALTVATEFVERVEVLKGPSALLTGMAPYGSIGGGINLVPKRAADTPLTQVTVSSFSDAQFGGHVDVGRRFGPDNRVGIRFNGVYRDGDTAVDRQRQELGAGVFGLDYRGERLRLSADLGYQVQNYDSPLRPTYVSAGVPVPTARPGTANWFQPWSYVDTKDRFGALRAEYDLSDDWTVFAAAGARRNRFDGVTGFATVLNARGDLNDAPLNFQSVTDTDTEEAGIRGALDTGPVRHALAMTGTRLHLRTGSLFPTVVTIRSNLYEPTFIARPSIPDIDPPKTGETDLRSLALADTLSVFDERIQLILGGRLQRVTIDNYSAATGARTSHYDKSALTPAVGLVVKPWKNVSLYGNYIEGLQQGGTAPVGTRNAGQAFPPFTSRQVEAGVKIEADGLGTTLSAFQIQQPSGFTDPATLTYGIDGEQRNRGLEWSVFGEPFDGVRLWGGASLIDAVLTGTAGGLANGKTATNAPRVQVNLGGEWDTPFLPGLTVSGRLIHTGSQYLDAVNTQSIPAWTRVDVGARYRFERPGGQPITLRVNVENLFDKAYWAAAGSTYGLSPGGPRTVLLSTTVDF